jgi:hypothetical protein
VILISAALVLAAIILLIAGVVLAKPFLVMWSIVISVLSAVCLLIGALLRRHELFPAEGRAMDAPAGPGTDMGVPQPVPAAVHAFAGGPAHQAPLPMPPRQVYPQQAYEQQVYPPLPAFPQQRVGSAGSAAAGGSGGGLPPDTIVLVIRGRRRFHLAGCRQLVDREVEELTHEEAREEGFTACTTCLFDDSPAGDTPADGSPATPEADTPEDRPEENSVPETGGVKNAEPVEPVEIVAPGRARPTVSSDSTTASTT